MTDPTRFDDPAGLERVTASLRALPTTHPAQVDRIVSAALARQHRARRNTTWALRAASVVLAVGLAAGGVWYGRESAPTTVAATAPATIDVTPNRDYVAPRPDRNLSLAAAGAADDAPVAVTFVFQRPDARRVAIVGDFDDWSPTAEPMQRGADGTWTTTVEIAPGRHGYAFVVDDTVWVTDPRAPVVHDPDYGRDHSVLVVGRP